MAEDYKVSVNVNVSKGELEALKTDIDALTAKPIDIKINTKSSALKAITDGANRMSDAFGEAKTEIAAMKSSLNGIGRAIGTVKDGSKTTKDLVTSINSISTSLSEASGNLEKLLAQYKELNAVDSKSRTNANNNSNKPSKSSAKTETVPYKQQGTDVVSRGLEDKSPGIIYGMLDDRQRQIEKAVTDYYNSIRESGTKALTAEEAMIKMFQDGGKNGKMTERGAKRAFGSLEKNLYDVLDDDSSKLGDKIAAKSGYISDVIKRAGNAGIDISNVTDTWKQASSASTGVKNIPAGNASTGTKNIKEEANKAQNALNSIDDSALTSILTKLDNVSSKFDEVATSISAAALKMESFDGSQMNGLLTTLNGVSQELSRIVELAQMVSKGVVQDASKTVANVADNATKEVEKKTTMATKETSRAKAGLSDIVNADINSIVDDKNTFGYRSVAKELQSIIAPNAKDDNEAKRAIQKWLGKRGTKGREAFDSLFDSENKFGGWDTLSNPDKPIGEWDYTRQKKTENARAFIGIVNDANNRKKKENRLDFSGVDTSWYDKPAESATEDAQKIGSATDKIKTSINEVETAARGGINIDFSSVVSQLETVILKFEQLASTIDKVLSAGGNIGNVAKSLDGVDENAKNLNDGLETADKEAKSLATDGKNVANVVADVNDEIGLSKKSQKHNRLDTNDNKKVYPLENAAARNDVISEEIGGDTNLAPTPDNVRSAFTKAINLKDEAARLTSKDSLSNQQDIDTVNRLQKEAYDEAVRLWEDYKRNNEAEIKSLQNKLKNGVLEEGENPEKINEKIEGKIKEREQLNTHMQRVLKRSEEQLERSDAQFKDKTVSGLEDDYKRLNELERKKYATDENNAKAREKIENERKEVLDRIGRSERSLGIDKKNEDYGLLGKEHIERYKEASDERKKEEAQYLGRRDKTFEKTLKDIRLIDSNEVKMSGMDKEDERYKYLKNENAKANKRIKNREKIYKYTEDQERQIEATKEEGLNKVKYADSAQADKQKERALKRRLAIDNEIARAQSEQSKYAENDPRYKNAKNLISELEAEKQGLDAQYKWSKDQEAKISSAQKSASRITNKASANSEAKQITDDINKTKEAVDELNAIKIKMFGLPEASDDFKELQKEADAAKKKVEEADAALGKSGTKSDRLTKEQREDYNDYVAKSNASVEEEKVKSLVKTMGDLDKARKNQNDARIKGNAELEKQHKSEVERLSVLEDRKMSALGITDDSYGSLSKDQIRMIEDAKKSRNIAEAGISDKNTLDDVKKTSDALDELIDKKKQIANLETRLINTDGKDTSALNEIAKELDNLKSKAKELQSSIGLVVDKDGKITSQGKLNDQQVEKYKKYLRDVEDEKKKRIDLASEIKSSFDNGYYKDDYTSLVSRRKSISKNIGKEGDEGYEKKKAEIANLDSMMSKTRSAWTSFSNFANGLTKKDLSDPNTIRRLVALESEFRSEVEKTTAEIKRQNKAQNDAYDAESAKARGSKLSDKMSKWLNANSKAVPEFGAQINEYISNIKRLDDQLDKGIISAREYRHECEKMDAGFSKISTNAQLAGKTGMNFADRLKMQFTRLSGYLTASFGLMEVVQGFRQMAQAVLEVDTAMTGLHRVTDLTSKSYDDLYDRMINSSKEYGQTLTDTINATTDWVRAGFDADTALGLAEKTAMYQNVSDLDYDEASENLLTSYNGFKEDFIENYDGDTVEAVGHIVDVLNELDNNFSVTSAGLGEGLSRSASALMLAGNTYEEAAAMIGAITEVTQDPEKSGQAMKILSLRLRGMKGELQDLGEDAEEGVESISKMQTQILNFTHGKVNIFDDAGEFKSTYDIMNDIAEVYDTLSTTEQADLLETIAGKHRANDVAALIDNWGNSEAMKESALNSAGSAATENARQVNSLQGHLNKLTASWQAFANTVTESDFLKGIVDIGSGALDVLSGIVDFLGVIPALATAAAAAFSLMGHGIFKVNKEDGKSFFKTTYERQQDPVKHDQMSGINIFGRSLSRLESIASGPKGSVLTEIFDSNMFKNTPFEKAYSDIEKYKKGLDDIKNRVPGAKKAQEDFLNSMDNSCLKTYLTTLGKTEASFGGYIKSLAAATIKTFALEAATMAMNAAVSMGVMLLVQFAITGIMSFINRAKELSDKVDDVTKTFNEQKAKLKDARSVMSDVLPDDGSVSRYEKLARGVNSFGQNISLTSEEYSEYLDTTNKIAESFPSLIKGYDSQGNAILSCRNNVHALAEAYDEMARSANDAVIANANDIFKDYRNKADELKNNAKNVDSDSIDIIEDILYSEDIDKAISDLTDDGRITTGDGELAKISKALQEQGFSYEKVAGGQLETNEQFVARVARENKDAFRKIISDFDAEAQAASEDIKNLAEAYLGNKMMTEEYEDMSDESKAFVNSLVPNMDIDYFHQFASVKDMYNSLGDMLYTINSFDAAGNRTFETYFELKTKFDNGDCTVGEYLNAVKDVRSTLEDAGLGEEEIKLVEMTLGVDSESLSGIKQLRQRFIDAASDIAIKDVGINGDDAKKSIDGIVKEYVNSLTGTELEVAVDLLTEGKLDLSSFEKELEMAKEAGADLGRTLYGNIDLNDEDRVIKWNKSNLNKYKKELESWGWELEKIKGTTSTVMAEYETYNKDGKIAGKDGEIKLAYTPLLKTENGLEVLNKSSVNKYMSELINKANSDGKIDDGELIRLDSEGLEIDGKKIQNILADVGDTAEKTARTMHYVGENGAIALSFEEADYDIKHAAEVLEAKRYTIDIEAETKGFESFNKALSEARTATGLTIESMDALKSRYRSLPIYDAARLFEETANGISVNADAVNEYEQALANQNLDETTKSLEVLEEEYNNLTAQIEQSRNSGNATRLAELMTEREEIKSKITELAELASAYDGLTSSYNEWQNAESSGNDRDMYETVASGFDEKKGIKSELDKGWIDDGTKEYFQLIWGEDKWSGAGKSVQDYRKKWGTLDDTIKGTSYSIQDFFKFNDDDELTSEGIFNFFDAVGQKQKQLKKDGKLKEDWIKYDKNGNMKSFNFGVDGDKAVADALGISEELVQIFLRASQDVGFVVNFNGAYTQLADLQTEAENAAQYLINIGKTKYKFNFDTTDITSLNEQLKEAKGILDSDKFWKDGVFNFDAKGAKEAMTVASTLQATIDSLDNHYLGITTEDDDMKEPLGKLQDYETKVAQINQLKLNPKANADDIKSLEGDLDEIVEYFSTEEMKAKFGIEADDDVREMIENGSLEIPAVLDIQANIDETLTDLLDVMLLNSGILDKDVELKIKADLQAKYNVEDDTSTKGEDGTSDDSKNDNKKEYDTDKIKNEKSDNQEDFNVKTYLKNSGLEKSNYSDDEKNNVLGHASEVANIGTFSNEENQKLAMVTRLINPEKYLEDDETRAANFVRGIKSEMVSEFTDTQDKNVYEFGTGIDVEKLKLAEENLNNISRIIKDVNTEELSDTEKSNVANLTKNITEKDIGELSGDQAKNLVNSGKRISTKNWTDNQRLNFANMFKDISKELNDTQFKNVSIFAKYFDSSELDSTQKNNLVNLIENFDTTKLNEIQKRNVASIGQDVDTSGMGFEQKDKVYNFAKKIDTSELTAEQKQVVVDVVANTEAIDEYNVGTKQAIVDFIANPKEVDEYSPTKRTAIVDFLANAENVDEWSPEKKQEYVEFLKDTTDIDGWTPEVEDALVNMGVDQTEIGKWKSEFEQERIDKQLTIVADVYGRTDVEQLQGAFDQLDDKDVQAIAETMGKGDVEGLQNAIKAIPDKKVANAIAQAFGYNDVNQLCSSIDNLNPKTVQAIAQALGITDVNSLRGVIAALSPKSVKAVAKTEGKDKVAALKNEMAKVKNKSVTIEAKASGIQSVIDKFRGLVKRAKEAAGVGGANGTVVIDGSTFSNGTGTTFANGTTSRNAMRSNRVVKQRNEEVLSDKYKSDGFKKTKRTFSTGTAFAHGSWGTKGSGVALGGETGQELVVRNGRWFTIGDNGAEFFKYKKNDIIFNAGQTKQLFEQGKIVNGRTRGMVANANGTAFSSGTAFASGIAFSDGTIADKPSYGDKKTTKKDSGSSSSDSKDTKEVFDWIEVKISRIERVISNLGKTIDSTYNKWKDRNAAIAKQMSNISKEISIQEAGSKRYMKQANKVKFTKKEKVYRDKVMNGRIDIETIKNEKLAEKIKEYQQWYEKAIACDDAILQLNEDLKELYKRRFDNFKTEFEGLLSIYDKKKSDIEEYIKQSEARGLLTSKKYYDALDKNLENQNKMLEQEKNALINARQRAITYGKIKEGSEEDLAMIKEINDIDSQILANDTEILENAKKRREIEQEVYELKQKSISNMVKEAEFLIDLLDSEELYKNNGQPTDEGMATLGLQAMKLNEYAEQAKLAKERIEALKNEVAANPDNKDLKEDLQSAIEEYQDYAKSIKEAKEAIRDFVEDGINKELDALQELIDKKNEELETEKDLYDYQKKVAEQTKEISSLEKQMAAYAGDDSEESKAKIQQLKVELEDARNELKETEYDQYISDQEKLLDDLYDEYEETINKRLDNLDMLVEDMIEAVNSNSGDINETLKEIASAYGYEISNETSSAWSGKGDAVSNYNGSLINSQTNLAESIDALKTSIDNMVSNSNSDAAKNINDANSVPVGQDVLNDGPSVDGSESGVGNKGTIDVAEIGDRPKFKKGKYHKKSSGGKTGKSYLGKYVYITKINDGAKYPYRISYKDSPSSKYALGWVKLSQLSGYAAGKRNFLDDEVAWTQENGKEMIVRPSDGAILTPIAKGDSVLNANASRNIWSMANSPADFIKDNLNLGSIDAQNGVSSQTVVEQNFDKVVFNLPNVKNYEQLLSAMQRDKNFERLITSMTIDQLAGKSSLAKGKAIR